MTAPATEESPESSPLPASEPPTVLFVSRDLMFESKVDGAARGLGVRVVSVGDAVSALRGGPPHCRGVLFDLALGTDHLDELVAEFQKRRKVPVIAFGSHVATALLESARAAGCREVMPRSRFSATLPELLRELTSD